MRWSRSSVRRARDLLLTLCLAAGPLAAGDLPLAYVTCQNGNALSVLDLSSGQETARWDVPGNPAGVAWTRAGVYTVSPEDKTVRRFDPDGTVAAQVTLDGGPIGIVVDEMRGRVYVSDWFNHRIWALSVDLEPVKSMETGATPAGLALSDDGRWLASADKDADQISLFHAETATLAARIPVGERPFGLQFAPDGRLFVGNVGSNDVSVIDTEAAHVTATIRVGERPYGVAFAQGRAFVTNQYANTVSVIDLATLNPLTTIEVGEYPEGIDVTPDGTTVVVANWFENSVTLIDPLALTVTGIIETADGPRAFGPFIAGGLP
ncbi:beta-propeller fold lactonase family protein [Sagittula salina]|uniref:Beta-propeller fold lactonase family protein n=1 Tax=Sagittula salina TaxID=2820268 RepID=A0A940MTR2_9RHOB|nr:beta-propeller fold lactonase family protein [Sagittula salina]MBP0484711.1 beta-propeller fold lactonase family protein [Sagittula salina]